ncbi:hypothetical protein BDV10DRAFT_197225 [Aspergillus recurvatus]
MSAMTGPRSPTSPWPQEPQTLALPGPSSPAALFPLPDSRPSSFNRISPRGASSRGTAAELPDNYFSFNTESPSNFKGKGHFPYALPNESPEGKFISGKDIAEQRPPFFGTGSGNSTCIPDPAVYKLSLNRQTGDSTSSGTTKSVSAPALGPSVRLVSTEACAELVGSHAHDLMLLDVRPYAHFFRGNIKGALNLCIPTTLLKRPSFDTKKLANTFTDEADRKYFGRWRQCRYIIVYDAATSNMKDAAPLANVVKKFTAEGWNGDGMILTGGFKAFSSRFPELTQQQQQLPALDAQSKKTSPMHIDLPQSAPVAGGCNIPESSNATIPFFGNIRQHMDLVGGVGQIPLKHSEHLPASQRRSLPPWLREVSDPADQGRLAASRFFDIEKTELERMKQALSYDQNNDSSSDKPSSPRYRVAGIEKGAKNRYNDIYPYDHSRVKLHDIPHGGCDYVNASYLKAEYSNQHYIATQAPVPDTFDDFWRVIWEQDIRLVVSLTAEVERGQVKCHPFWKSGTYGQFHVNNFSKKYIPMEPADPSNPQSVVAGVEKSSTDSTDNPTLIVRHFGLTKHLFSLLKRRASKQLYGSQFDASCITFKFGNQALNIKASSLTHYADEALVFATRRDQDIVQILQVRERQIVPLWQAKLPWGQWGSIDILKTAFDGSDGLYVLHRFTPFIEGRGRDWHHPFVKQARQSNREGFIYLTRYSLKSPNGSVRMTTFPEHADFEPSALAAASEGIFAIAWCHRMFSNHVVVHYTVIDGSEYDIAPNLIGFSYLSRQLRKWHGQNTRGPMVRDMVFNDRSSQLLYYYQAKTLYASFQKLGSSDSPILYENSTSVQFANNLSLLFSIGVPFFGTHETLDLDGLAVCRWRYLSLGIATHRKENWTVACVLRSEASCRAINCRHILNLDRGRRLRDWGVVARLYGFRDSKDTLGCKVATSPKGTRIAVTNWNVLYIWALEPGALINMDLENYYHPSWRSSSTGQIELRPIVLRLDAVCFQLRFTEKEDELVAITDRGIMLWNLTSARGTRTCQELAI